MRERPLVSVIIPNWNGAKHLPTCLNALRRQTMPEFEVVVVDNGSTDVSCSLVREQFPEVQLHSLPQNEGFVRAVNAGIRATSSPFIALLNNDTEPEPRWLEELCRPLRNDPDVGFCASKLLLFDRRDVIHSAGDYYQTNGIPGNRGVWERDVGQFDREEEVFGACGGAAAYRRDLFDAVGLFDEVLWMYCEDVDLNLRANAAGFRCRYVPTARVYHRLSATGGGPLASYWCGRNFVVVYLKSMPRPLVRRYWRRFLAAQARLAVDAVAHGREAAARAWLRGQLAGFRMLPALARTRRDERSSSSAAVARLATLLEDGDALAQARRAAAAATS